MGERLFGIESWFSASAMDLVTLIERLGLHIRRRLSFLCRSFGIARDDVDVLSLSVKAVEMGESRIANI